MPPDICWNKMKGSNDDFTSRIFRANKDEGVLFYDGLF